MMHRRVKDMPRNQQQAVMSKIKPKIVVRTRMDGTVVTYESPVYVGEQTLPSGKTVKRYMNPEEARAWSKETGNPVKRI